ncbi:ankyrin repeat-containing domain protein [Corynascus similis CBS 632.67]
MYEPLEKQPISVTSSGAPEFDDSCKFLVESWKDHIFAVLLWRPKHEFPVTVPATFQARDAETDEIWLCDSSDISASLSPAPVEGPQPWTPFSWALRCNWQDALQLLLQQPEVLQNLRDSVGRSALSWAAGTGHELATGLLMARPDTNPNEQDDQGRTPLSWAAGAGQTRIMQILLGSDHGDGVDLDSPARSGRTRRSWAAAEGKVGSVRVSLSSEKSKTANPSIPDKHGRTPLSWAAGNGHAEAVQLLIRQGKMTGLTEELTGDGKLPDNSPFFWAARNGHDNVLRLLLEEQLSRAPTSMSLSYQTYLHKAAKQGWATVVKLLVQQGVSIDTQDPDNDDYTPLCVAAESGLVDVVILLLQADANRNHQTSETRETPLHLAVRHGHDAVVKALIEAGADITLMDAKGDSPKSLAQRLNNDHIFNMIAAVDKEGGLAETASAQYLVPSVDLEFLATVVDFTPGSGSVENTAMELNVSSLLKDPHARLRQLSGRRAIRWLHLPANNVSQIMSKFEIC